MGEIADKHVQIPPVDADLYADVVDRVTLSFDWNRKKNVFVGTPTFQNYPGKASNLFGMERKCPTGKLNSPYEHFDIVEIKQSAPGQPPPNSSASAFTPTRWSPNLAVRTCVRTRARSARRRFISARPTLRCSPWPK